jgi:hypothetical protein
MTSRVAPPPSRNDEISCRLCAGHFPHLADPLVEGCSLCEPLRADPDTFAPRHFSYDECRSGAPRRHAGCVGRNSHCACDRCF